MNPNGGLLNSCVGLHVSTFGFWRSAICPQFPFLHSLGHTGLSTLVLRWCPAASCVLHAFVF